MTPPTRYRLPCGSWPSPISASMVAAGGTRLSGPVAVTGAGPTAVFWLEGRPTEGGRSALVSEVNGRRTELSAPWSARTAVHEYGGGAFWPGTDCVYFTEWSDQRIYRAAVTAEGALDPSAEPTAVTALAPSERAWRYADGRQHPDNGYLVCVMENHHDTANGAEPTNTVVAVVPGGPGDAHPLVSGPDFVSTPRISADGGWISWIEWNHPNMPWNETTLRAAPLFGGPGEVPRLGNVQTVADGEAIHGADWTADGRLVYSTDRSGFWNLAWWSPTGGAGTLTDLTEAEIGHPPWNFGTQQWTELADGRLVAVVTAEATDSLAVVDAPGAPTPVAGVLGPMSVLGLATAGTTVIASVAGSSRLPEVVTIDVDVDEGSEPLVHTLRAADEVAVDVGWMSAPESIWFESDGRPTQCFFYPPSPAGVSTDGGDGASDELPPLIVLGHGGPTSHSGPDLHLRVQFWTSRGFAVADVNYGGSTGFGKSYRDRLDGRWGILDVDDCVAAARHLAGAGLVDENRMAIRGGSAGGLTVMNALITSDAFQAGTSLYGVADLAALATETHKFEARYLDRLVGPYPEAAEVYASRSPIHHADRLSAPMLVLQGSEDAVVPPQQSRAIVEALAERDVPHAYIEFDGEQHGFRQADNIVRALEAELWFYGRVFGFSPADDIEAPEHCHRLNGGGG